MLWGNSYESLGKTYLSFNRLWRGKYALFWNTFQTLSWFAGATTLQWRHQYTCIHLAYFHSSSSTVTVLMHFNGCLVWLGFNCHSCLFKVTCKHWTFWEVLGNYWTWWKITPAILWEYSSDGICKDSNHAMVGMDIDLVEWALCNWIVESCIVFLRKLVKNYEPHRGLLR